ncbi:MAG TPA: hypothetical protein VNN73_18215 [Blastocatellia bacterium]|nr:hypothetical protein [Blastocatellia bacterium]
MKRLLILIAALTFTVGLSAPYASAHTQPAAAQDDAAKKEAEAAYRSWYEAYTGKDYAKAIQLAKDYLAKFPSGERASYFQTWLASPFVLRIEFKNAATANNKEEALRIGKLIIASKDVKDEERLQYLLFLNNELIKELSANPPNYAHAADISDFSQQIITLVEADKIPTGTEPGKWNKNSVLAYYNGVLGLIEQHNKNTDKALEYYAKAAAANPAEPDYAYRCGLLHQDKYIAAQAKFEAFPEADRQAVAANKPEAKPEVKAALDEVNKEVDAIIECWARYIGITQGKPDPNGARAKIEEALKGFYQYRHNNTLDGYQQLIDKYKSGSAAPSSSQPAGTPKPPEKQ